MAGKNLKKLSNLTLSILATAFLFLVSGAGFAFAAAPTNGLVAHWSFDQSSGTILTDNSGNGHNGTLSGTPTWTAGKINNDLAFDGTDKVALGNITQIDNVGQVTLAAWIKRNATSAKVEIGKQTSKNDITIEAYSDGKIYFQTSNGSDAYGSLTLNDTAWHHVALVFDGTQSGNANRLKAYVDGVQKTLAFSGTIPTKTTSNTTVFNIGVVSGEYSNGQVDDMWLYSRALNQTEIQIVMQNGSNTPTPTPTSIPPTATPTPIPPTATPTPTPIPNNPPQIAPLTGATININDTYAENGSFTDPDSTSWSATVDYGDGAGAQILVLNADNTFSLSHIYTTAGVKTVTVQIHDDSGNVATRLATVTVVGPTATPTPVPPTPTPTNIPPTPTPTSVPTPTPTGIPGQFSYVTTVSSNGRYFLDQNGSPTLIKGDSPWALLSDLSPDQVQLWATDRQSYGFNAAIMSLIGSTANGGPSNNGGTYDGIVPFNNGNITSFNEAYWSRMDQYLGIMRDHGITVFLYPMDGWTTKSGNAMYHKSAADSFTYGQMVANRYKNYPNIVWMAGGDYQYWDDQQVATEFTNMLAGIRSTGDTRPFSIQHTLESDSTDIPTFEPLASWNFAYSYSMIYEVVLRAYEENLSSHDPRPVMLGESNYEGENNTGGPATTNETLRRQILWALTSGSAGEFSGTQDWLFYAGWQNRLDTAWTTQEKILRNFWQSLSNWQLLVPDDKNHVVTTGRGTQITQDSSLDVLQNDYVTAAQTPDKSLTVVYVPTNVGNTNARTITLDLTKLPAGYTANWVDPTNATQSQPATIDASGNVTTPGLHTDGTRDWLLVIHN